MHMTYCVFSQKCFANTPIFVSSFQKFISHRCLLNCMWSDILWLKFCFHGTAPICIFVLALRTSLLIAHVFLLSSEHFFRPTFHQEAIAKDRSLASFLEKSIHLWMSCRNGLELFISCIQLVYGVLMQRDRLVPFLVWSEPLALQLP